jgi:hypothetical protein
MFWGSSSTDRSMFIGLGTTPICELRKLYFSVLSNHHITPSCLTLIIQIYSFSSEPVYISNTTEWPKKMYTLFTHQYLWNKFK